MIHIWQAIILGVIQGITEFLPVSSTAHLILVPWFFHWPDPGLTFDVALHAGTLLAIIGFFFMTWIRIIRAGFGAAIDIHTGAPISGPALAVQQRLLWFLVLATIPGGIIGLAFDKEIESTWRNPLIIAASLIVVGILMGWADRMPERNEARRMRQAGGEQAAQSVLAQAAGSGAATALAATAERQAPGKDFDKTSMWEAWWIGCAQAVAVIPGISRSGSTITAGLFAGLSREAAARFSFLMATPIIAGAVLYKAHQVQKTGIPAGMHGPFVAGVIASGIVGIVSIWLFIRFLKLNTLRFFVWYRVILGLIVIGLFFAGFRAF
ncbi:MAG: undecaprenyl-diphosphate phosphatase [Terriglobales bacterium]